MSDQTLDPAVPVEGGDGIPNRNQDWNYAPNEEGSISIPVRIGSRLEDAPPANDLPQDEDEIVREYERKYYRQNLYAEAPPQPRVGDVNKQKRQWDLKDINVKMPPRHRYQTRPALNQMEDVEKTWAAIAHASALLTFLVLIVTAGPGVVLTALIPLGIYLAFRKKSEFVAFHALQAFTIQVVGTIGAFLLLLTGGAVLVTLIIISAVLSIILIGIPFVILFTLMLIGLVLFSMLLPVAMVVYSMIAADAAYKGRNYRYPYIADWLDDQLKNGMLGSVI